MCWSICSRRMVVFKIGKGLLKSQNLIINTLVPPDDFLHTLRCYRLASTLHLMSHTTGIELYTL